MSDRSFNGWKRYRSVVEAMFSQGHALPRPERARRRALQRPRRAEGGGHRQPQVRFAAARCRARGGGVAQGGARRPRPVWMAASTHPGEDEIVADAHRTPRRGASRPRSPSSCPAIPSAGRTSPPRSRRAGLTVARRQGGGAADAGGGDLRRRHARRTRPVLPGRAGRLHRRLAGRRTAGRTRSSRSASARR